MTCELILAVKTVFAAKITAEHVAWISRSLGAMFGSIVSFQITDCLSEMTTTLLGALIFSLMSEMGCLVVAERFAGVRFQMMWNRDFGCVLRMRQINC